MKPNTHIIEPFTIANGGYHAFDIEDVNSSTTMELDDILKENYGLFLLQTEFVAISDNLDILDDFTTDEQRAL